MNTCCNLQTLPDHLVFVISTLGKGDFRVPERRCFSLCRQACALNFETVKNRPFVDSDLIRRFTGATISYLSTVSLTSLRQRSLQIARTVQAEIVPVSISRQQPALLAQLRVQEPREPARAMTRSTIYCDLHRLIGHHRLGRTRCCIRPTRQRDRVRDGGRRKKC